MASSTTSETSTSVQSSSSSSTGTETRPSKKLQNPSPGFFDNSPEMTQARSLFFKILGGGSLVLILVIFAFFSIYWGALWKTPAHSLSGWIVNFDNDSIGEAVLNGLLASSKNTKISWTVVPASQYPDGPGHVAHDILNEKAWVAVVVHSGATATLRSAVSAADASYNGSDAITVYAVEARSENAFRSLIRPTVQASLGAITQQFASQFARATASQSADLLSRILTTAPQLVISPVGYTIENIRPFDVPVASAITFVGLIYLLILSFFIVMIGLNAREISGLERVLGTASIVKLRLASVFTIYFLVSLFYSLLSLAFQVDFSRRFGHGGFVLFWLVNYIGMLSVGMALESMITILTVRGIPFFMILWIISDVSVCFLPIEVMPHIFRYGYAAPFYNVSRAVRTIIFGTKNDLGLNFGVLLAWVVISMITLPLFQWYTRRGKDAAPVDLEEKGKEVHASS